MTPPLRRIILIADIEGSSGCWSHEASSFLGAGWPRACLEMTRDVAAVAGALFEAGAESVLIKDFHRTGYNLLPEMIDPRAELIPGYRTGPVPGLGEPGSAEAVMFTGMHAASGTTGFLAHTLTSRLAGLEVNGRPLSEVQLISASLGPFGLRPVFFSGCPIACRQAEEALEGIRTYHIDKSRGPDGFDAAPWRSGLAEAAAGALNNLSTRPYLPSGPFQAAATIRDGRAAARKLARQWGFEHKGDRIFIQAADVHQLYLELIRLCYLTPLIEKTLPYPLYLYDLLGRYGLWRVRRRLKKQS